MRKLTEFNFYLNRLELTNCNKAKASSLIFFFSENLILLTIADDHKYYKVPVLSGSRLSEGQVPHTCRSVGLEAVCSGPEHCMHTNTTNCLITPLSTACGTPQWVTRAHEFLLTHLPPLSGPRWLSCSVRITPQTVRQWRDSSATCSTMEGSAGLLELTIAPMVQTLCPTQETHTMHIV